MVIPFVGEVPKATALLVLLLFVLLFFIILFYKEWKITTFDPSLATSLGIQVIFMNHLFMGLVSITTVASFDAVGAIMVVAMLITPAASAYLWTDKLIHMIFTSGVFGVASAIAGYYIADWIDTSISGSMAFATGIVFLISFLLSPKHGLLSKYVRPPEVLES
ncbi:ABC transporter family protein [Pseudogracilibacillus auburnensis]|uniref:ABC transporter family protein n=1 Tax=Pseudogracilibacillus auburnensis TaxID=1494959 RepID=A0A2V3VMB6_9BACI|nr:ABC transporter family protein [Pseudogracilibacillus auburnensis]